MKKLFEKEAELNKRDKAFSGKRERKWDKVGQTRANKSSERGEAEGKRGNTEWEEALRKHWKIQTNWSAINNDKNFLAKYFYVL